MRCRSQFCITSAEGLKGREFTPVEGAQGLAKIWCPQCVSLGRQLQFFSTQTAQMIRLKYQEMRVEDLPKDVANILTAFTRDIISELGEEL